MVTLGPWKSADNSGLSFSYSGLKRGREQCTLPNSTPLFTPIPESGNFGFGGNSAAAPISCDPMFWSNRVEPLPEAVVTGRSRVAGEKRQETGNGCRLFGIQLVENSPMEEITKTTTISGEDGDMPVQSLDADSDQQSEPSNTHQSDIPAVSSEPDKSCLRSPQEMQSRQIRSCTKVSCNSTSLVN